VTGALAMLAGALLGLCASGPVHVAWMWIAPVPIAGWAMSSAFHARLRVPALLLLGLWITSVDAHAWMQLRLPVEGADQRGLLEGRILDVPERVGSSWRFDVEGRFVEGAGADGRVRRVRLVSPPAATPRVGERWQWVVRLMPLEPTRNFAGLDAARFAYRDGIHAAGRVLPSARNRLLSLAPASLHGLRARITSRIEEAIVDPDAAALCKALAVGLTSDMSADQWRVFNATGTTHLVAISGLHVTLFAWLSFRLARVAWRWLPIGIERDPFAWSVGLLAAGGYALLAGLSVPTQRTWLMLAIFVAARLACRHIAAARLWALALIAVLLWEPRAPLSAGFWLSFGAVAVLMSSPERGTVSPPALAWT
jgi:competence protein ComEC